MDVLRRSGYTAHREGTLFIPMKVSHRAHTIIKKNAPRFCILPQHHSREHVLTTIYKLFEFPCALHCGTIMSIECKFRNQAIFSMHILAVSRVLKGAWCSFLVNKRNLYVINCMFTFSASYQNILCVSLRYSFRYP